MDYKEFAQKVKTKYPQYSDMNDEELARKMVAKFPKEYSDVVFPQQQNQEQLSAMEQRFPLASKGIQQAKQGNPVAGGLNIANQAFSEVARPFQQADELLRKVPVAGEGISNLLRIPPYLASKAVEYGTQGIQATGIPKMLNNILPLDKSGETAEALNTTNQSIAPFLVAPPIMKTAGKTPQVIGRGAQVVADAISQSAYKIPPSIKASERTDILRTAQKEGITPTASGLKKLDAKVGELKSFAEGLEQQAISNGSKSVPTREIVQNIDAVIEKWKGSDTPRDFTNALKAYKSKVIKQNKASLTVDDMVDLKRNLQGQLSSIYEKQMKINPSIRETLLQEAKSAVEQSVRGKLEQIIPEYKNTNSQIHKLLNLKDYVQQSANRISNHNLLTIRDAFVGGSAYNFGADPVTALSATVLSRILLDQRVQAYLGNSIAPSGRIPKAINAIPSSTRVLSQLPISRQENQKP